MIWKPEMGEMLSLICKYLFAVFIVLVIIRVLTFFFSLARKISNSVLYMQYIFAKNVIKYMLLI